MAKRKQTPIAATDDDAQPALPVQPGKVIVRFTRHNAPYNSGEIAGFDQAEADVLIASGAAVKHVSAEEAKAEAIEYVMSRGYSRENAEGIVEEHGAAKILASRAEDAEDEIADEISDSVEDEAQAEAGAASQSEEKPADSEEKAG